MQKLELQVVYKHLRQNLERELKTEGKDTGVSSTLWKLAALEFSSSRKTAKHIMYYKAISLRLGTPSLTSFSVHHVEPRDAV
jgi:hypothetical protein